MERESSQPKSVIWTVSAGGLLLSRALLRGGGGGGYHPSGKCLLLDGNTCFCLAIIENILLLVQLLVKVPIEPLTSREQFVSLQ